MVELRSIHDRRRFSMRYTVAHDSGNIINP
jgi:hypothetical protein